MRQATAMEVLVWATAVYLLVYVLTHTQSEQERLERLVRNTPCCDLATAPESSIVRLVGQAYAQSPRGPGLYAPITGRPCLMYLVAVEQLDKSNGSDEWRQIILERNGVPFLLIDKTGKALIDPTIAHTVLKLDREAKSGPFDAIDPSKEAFLARHLHTSKSWLFHAELRYREAVIDIGETIAVFGSGVREPDPDGIPNGDYRAAMPLRMRFAGSAKYPLIISDDPKATLRTPRQLPPASQG